jgi:LPS-assembly protein
MFFSIAINLGAQTYRPSLPPPAGSPQASPNVNQPVKILRAGAPGPDDILLASACRQDSQCTQDQEGPWIHLRGTPTNVETIDMQLWADEIDYNRDTHRAEARGHVRFEHYARGEKLNCERAEYNVDDETGTFYEVSGSAPTRIVARPGLLTTTTPFYFQAKWAERKQDHYVLHQGFLTDCVIPDPWWRLVGKEFDLVPGDHAVARRSWFYIRRIPLFYAPLFYKSLKKEPRRTGLLTPNIGNNSLKGLMVGLGFYWAINRSYDLMYDAQYFSKVGVEHIVDFRGKANATTDFSMSLYGLNDNSTDPSISTGGYSMLFDGKSKLADGWEARGHLDLLSSFTFRQEFSETLSESISSETHSVGYLTKHWADYGVNIVAERDLNFQDTTPGDKVVLSKLPEIQFVEHEHEVRDWPVWFSFESSDGLEHRSDPGSPTETAYQTPELVERADFAPRLTTAFHWLGINVMPSFGIRETFYDDSIADGQLSSHDIVRSSHDVSVDILLPSLERIFNAPAWMGSKVKHVIEPRITYKYVGGIDNFNQILRFDPTDLISDTNQVEFSLTNRLLAKDKNGTVTDLLSWQFRYDRYFDPTFGGAVTPGQRNVVESVADLTGFSFLDGYRHQSPLVSDLKYQSKVGFEWRTDYDFVRHGFVNSSLSVNGHISKWTFTAGHSFVRTDPILAPEENQLLGNVTYGNQTRRGWNAGFSAMYDYRQGVLLYSLSQVTYNTDCCGISTQYRRLHYGLRDENQFLVSFAVSNIGTFGTLKKQERIF